MRLSTTWENFCEDVLLVEFRNELQDVTCLQMFKRCCNMLGFLSMLWGDRLATDISWVKPKHSQLWITNCKLLISSILHTLWPLCLFHSLDNNGLSYNAVSTIAEALKVNQSLTKLLWVQKLFVLDHCPLMFTNELKPLGLCLSLSLLLHVGISLHTSLVEFSCYNLLGFPSPQGRDQTPWVEVKGYW